MGYPSNDLYLFNLRNMVSWCSDYSILLKGYSLQSGFCLVSAVNTKTMRMFVIPLYMCWVSVLVAL